MSLSQRILQRVEKLFSKGGFHTIGYDEELHELVLSNGRDSVIVKVIFEDEADWNTIYEELASIFEKTSEYNMVYIAIPRILVENVETASFMKKGVGLIVYDDYSAEEKIPPEFFRKTQVKQVQEIVRIQYDEKSLRRIESLIKDLSERIDSLEKAYFSLLREVREMKSLLGKKVMVIEKSVENLHPKLEEHIESSDLPSFLKDNPWVEILSKRSEETI
ncbi:MAG: hypothetical protein RMI79_00575 [Nitrososphaerota archaeon]|nr:hypothetical protein [Nitrososphaerota archaeon]